MMQLSANYLSKYRKYRVKVKLKNPKYINMWKYRGDTKATVNLVILQASTTLLLVIYPLQIEYLHTL